MIHRSKQQIGLLAACFACGYLLACTKVPVPPGLGDPPAGRRADSPESPITWQPAGSTTGVQAVPGGAVPAPRVDESATPTPQPSSEAIVTVEVGGIVPYSTTGVTIQLRKASALLASSSFNWNPGTTGVKARYFFGESLGSVTAEVKAFRGIGASGELIAQGSVAGIQSALGGEATVRVALKSLRAPAISALGAPYGTAGEFLEIAGQNFGNSERVPVEAFFYDGVKASEVKRLSDGRLKVGIPGGAVTGPIVVKADGVESGPSAPFWIAGNLWLGEGYPNWDSLSDASYRYLYAGDTAKFSATPYWSYKTGENADTFGRPPTVSARFWDPEPSIGSTSADGTLTAMANSADNLWDPVQTFVMASFGSLVRSRCIRVYSQQCPSFFVSSGIRFGSIPSTDFFSAVESTLPNSGFPVADIPALNTEAKAVDGIVVTGRSSTSWGALRAGSTCVKPSVSLEIDPPFTYARNTTELKINLRFDSALGSERGSVTFDWGGGYYFSSNLWGIPCYNGGSSAGWSGIKGTCLGFSRVTCESIEMTTRPGFSAPEIFSNMGCAG